MISKFKHRMSPKKAVCIAIAILAIAVIAGTLLYIPCWKLLILWKINTLNVPEKTTEVYPAKAWISDVYWPHMKGEKVLDCEIGYESAKAYIEANNPAWKLKNLEIVEYGAMSDIAIYALDCDDEYPQKWNTDNCVHIVYFKKIFEWW